MTASARPSALAGASQPRYVEIVITPTPAQADQLADDLARLRALGADSNTQAILEAVHSAARSGVGSGDP